MFHKITRNRLYVFKDNVLLHLFTIILLTFVCYYNSSDNFFYGDDFIWLDRVKHLKGNWLSIFNPENYFTPLTYISFYLNYKLFGFNSYWYHLHDIIIHSFNGLLLYYVTYLIDRNKLTSLLSATFFVTSPSLVITVLWPSARTDLLMVSFLLITVITFIKTYSGKYCFLPLIFYIMALCAKGTVLLMPVMLFFLTSKDKRVLNRLKELAPYIVVNIIYILLLTFKMTSNVNNTTAKKVFLSLNNIIKSLPTLFIPERRLAEAEPLYLIVICCIIICIFVLMNATTNSKTIIIGSIIIFCGLAPLMIARNYVLAGNNSTTLQLLSSPSNRLYLAGIGVSLVYAFVSSKLITCNSNIYIKISFYIMILSLLIHNYYEISYRNIGWNHGTNLVKRDLHSLNNHSELISNNTFLLLYNFEGSSGFCNAMIRSYFDIKDIEVYRFEDSVKDVFTDMINSPIGKAIYNPNMPDVNLIMSCNDNVNGSELTSHANILLNSIVNDYKKIKLDENISIKEESIVINRLNDSMTKFRNVLSNCITSL